MSAPAGVSIREFARLDGCSDKLVRNAIKRAILPVLEGNKVDPALAGSGWRKQNRSADKAADTPKRSAPAAKPDLTTIDSLSDEDFIAEILAGNFRGTMQAERVKENALAAKHLLAARKQADGLVDLETAEAVLFEQARMFRDAWMNWPVRVGPLIAAELGVAVEPVVEALSKHVQQTLNDLGEPDADFAARES
jgi:hypothetical protein